jgi:hypothetical protein
MSTSSVDDEIAKLGGELSEIYFHAKHELARMQDSSSEGFSEAALIVRAFWKRVGSARHGTSVCPALKANT